MIVTALITLYLQSVVRIILRLGLNVTMILPGFCDTEENVIVTVITVVCLSAVYCDCDVTVIMVLPCVCDTQKNVIVTVITVPGIRDSDTTR